MVRIYIKSNKSNKRAGLRYEDLLTDQYHQVKEALELASDEVKIGRERRLKRAVDLSYKRKSLTDYAPDMKLEPFKEELYEDLCRIKERDDEYSSMNLYHKQGL